jgi:hypothetical protein
MSENSSEKRKVVNATANAADAPTKTDWKADTRIILKLMEAKKNTSAEKDSKDS